MDHPRAVRPALALTLAVGLALALGLLFAACSGSSDDARDVDTEGTADIAREGRGDSTTGSEADSGADDADVGAGGAGGDPDENAGRAAPASAVPREVVAAGSVGMRSEDVARTRAEIRALTTALGGLVQAEETSDADEGDGWSQLTLRVPTAAFDTAIERLAGLGSRVSVSRSTEDVTTEVADVRVRVTNQRRSIARIRQLLARAENISAIIAIESELAQREADLASLQAQQEVLADRTSLSTITVTVEHHEPAERGRDEDGFLGGLADGWDALAGSGAVALRVTGLLLPWLVLLGVLAVPGVPLARRLRARTTARTRSAA